MGWSVGASRASTGIGYAMHIASRKVRTCVLSRSTRVCRASLQQPLWNAAFMQQLQESLKRQEVAVADQVGIPGLRIQQGMAAGGESTGALVWSAGIVGITCAALGAHVLLTDKEDMVGSTTENVNANAAIIEAAGGSTQVAVLNWDQPDEDILAQPYDWVLAADVTYEPAALEHLAGLMSRLVSANPDSMVKLAHRYRSSALDKTMRETFNGYGLVLRPVDVRSTATASYVDPIKAEEAIVFYRVLPM
ncbi:uncharacterized protein HaLaN_09939 [Haematococcus lacustris]|uniref:Uncharacterized protein n=1 Tax=Haematococcus lacustris TaxID=44745 RepID=A0A699Z4K3_HAELA|nr:uncharacterized protein HaLaN_09939 [Haematococcus lacustris]